MLNTGVFSVPVPTVDQATTVVPLCGDCISKSRQTKVRKRKEYCNPAWAGSDVNPGAQSSVWGWLMEHAQTNLSHTRTLLCAPGLMSLPPLRRRCTPSWIALFFCFLAPVRRRWLLKYPHGVTASSCLVHSGNLGPERQQLLFLTCWSAELIWHFPLSACTQFLQFTSSSWIVATSLKQTLRLVSHGCSL